MTIQQSISSAIPRLTGKVALVTGGGSGIGRAAALAYARHGAMVVVAGRQLAPLQETVTMISALGGAASAVITDVARADQVQAMVAHAASQFGNLDMVFNNAGTEGVFAPIGELSEANYDAVLGINLKGAWLCAKYAAQAMLVQGHGGAIVNTASWLTQLGVGGSSAYAASKGGLLAMSQALAVELGPQGIRVNTVSPGIIATPMFDRLGGSDALAATFAAATPLRRVGLAGDVGDVAVWLCSDEARFVTGQNIVVDGGYTIAGL